MTYLININYSFSIFLFFLGLYVVAESFDNMKKLFGLSLFQTSVLWFYLSLGKVMGANPPICTNANCSALYSNPLPQVLMLTAIVVGLATIALGFALLVKIQELENNYQSNIVEHLQLNEQ